MELNSKSIKFACHLPIIMLNNLKKMPKSEKVGSGRRPDTYTGRFDDFLGQVLGRGSKWL
jgi:hypothetical protein